MRKPILTLILFAASFVIKAQAYEDKIEYNKEKQACIVMEYNFPPLAVENAVVAKMNKLGLKGKEEKGMFNKDKGFRVYKDAMIGDISPARYNYIVNVDRKSRKEADDAVLYLIIMKEDINALSRLNTEEVGKAKSFLYNLLPDIEAENLELQITAQEDVVVKAEKKLKTLKDDKDDMEKRLKKLQEDIKQNEKDQEKQTSEIENQRKALDALKSKRKDSA
jgi:gas vesicle protein